LEEEGDGATLQEDWKDGGKHSHVQPLYSWPNSLLLTWYEESPVDEKIATHAGRV
jgi:hypothetical protein